VEYVIAGIAVLIVGAIVANYFKSSRTPKSGGEKNIDPRIEDPTNRGKF